MTQPLIAIVAVGLIHIATVACASGDSRREPAQAGCNPTTGLEGPLPVCSNQAPCTQTLKVGNVITNPTDVPTCKNTNPSRPLLEDKGPIEWKDPEGVTRYHCAYTPRSKNRPLLVFFHGAAGDADHAYSGTSLRQKAEKDQFVLVSIQGRNLHWPNHPDGQHHDIYFRDLGSPSKNPDVAYADHLIDDYVSRGLVNPRQIYVLGWSNGALFAQLYAIARHDTPTPGGNRVAAGAAFGFGDPLNNTTVQQTPSCALSPYPRTSVPLYLINRACDSATPCNDAQNSRFERPPGYSAEAWVNTLTGPMENRQVTFKIIDFKGRPVDSCQAAFGCLKAGGLINHIRWPDGVDDGGGIDWEMEMLSFFRETDRSSHETCVLPDPLNSFNLRNFFSGGTLNRAQGKREDEKLRGALQRNSAFDRRRVRGRNLPPFRFAGNGAQQRGHGISKPTAPLAGAFAKPDCHLPGIQSICGG